MPLLLDLRYPAYAEDGSEDISFTDKKLMEEEELIRFMSSDNGGKNLLFINYFKTIVDASSLG